MLWPRQVEKVKQLAPDRILAAGESDRGKAWTIMKANNIALPVESEAALLGEAAASARMIAENTKQFKQLLDIMAIFAPDGAPFDLHRP
eukprot:1939610-Pyramimonas_sp.AAC.1